MLPLQYAQLGNIVADPISVVLVALGAVLVGVPSLVFGYLSLRGLLAAATPE